MTPKEFFDLVTSMRKFQKEFFKTRNSDAFHKSIELEKKVDKEINRVLDVTGGRRPREKQTELF